MAGTSPAGGGGGGGEADVVFIDGIVYDPTALGDAKYADVRIPPDKLGPEFLAELRHAPITNNHYDNQIYDHAAQLTKAGLPFRKHNIAQTAAAGQQRDPALAYVHHAYRDPEGRVHIEFELPRRLIPAGTTGLSLTTEYDAATQTYTPGEVGLVERPWRPGCTLTVHEVPPKERRLTQELWQVARQRTELLEEALRRTRESISQQVTRITKHRDPGVTMSDAATPATPAPAAESAKRPAEAAPADEPEPKRTKVEAGVTAEELALMLAETEKVADRNKKLEDLLNKERHRNSVLKRCAQNSRQMKLLKSFLPADLFEEYESEVSNGDLLGTATDRVVQACSEYLANMNGGGNLTATTAVVPPAARYQGGPTSGIGARNSQIAAMLARLEEANATGTL